MYLVTSALTSCHYASTGVHKVGACLSAVKRGIHTRPRPGGEAVSRHCWPVKRADGHTGFHYAFCHENYSPVIFFTLPSQQSVPGTSNP